jgi:D-glycero-D-manno-heptose 1,7-bisphosphate phosphatase
MGKHEIAQRAVFLDRDAVLNWPSSATVNPILRRVEDFELYEDVVEGCARLKAAEFLLVVITNQPDVGGPHAESRSDRGAACKNAMLPSLDHSEICYHAGERYGESGDYRKLRPGHDPASGSRPEN